MPIGVVVCPWTYQHARIAVKISILASSIWDAWIKCHLSRHKISLPPQKKIYIYKRAFNIYDWIFLGQNSCQIMLYKFIFSFIFLFLHYFLLMFHRLLLELPLGLAGWIIGMVEPLRWGGLSLIFFFLGKFYMLIFFFFGPGGGGEGCPGPLRPLPWFVLSRGFSLSRKGGGTGMG